MHHRRLYDRYCPGTPIIVETDRGTFSLIPNDISVGGCFVCAIAPWPIGAEVSTVRIPLDVGEVESRAELFERGAKRPRHSRFAEGFGLRWQFDADSTMRLDDCLRRTTREPSPDAKVSYIIAEQDGILREIQHLEDAKAKRIQFAFGLIAAYFAYAVAPLTLFHELGTELAAFYALGGFWGSIALLVHSNRFLHFLGDAHRQKGLLRKAFNAHRGYVLGRDRAYYEKTILPVGIAYDPKRAWTSSEDAGRIGAESYPGAAAYTSAYPTLYMLFLQVLFVAGAIHFLSCVMRVVDGVEFTRVVKNAQAPDTMVLTVFSPDYFLLGFVANIWLVLSWVQLSGNTCLHYHRATWEAKHIAIHRPNPRATGEGFWKIPGLRWLRKAVAWSFGLYATACLLNWLPTVQKRQGIFAHWAFGHLLHPVTALIVVGTFLALKIAYVHVSLVTEKEQYWDAKRLDQVEAKARPRGRA